MARLVPEIGKGRTEAFDKAVYLIHTSPQCEDWLVERLRDLRCANGFTHMRELVEDRLLSLYSLREASAEMKSQVARTVDRALQDCLSGMGHQTIADVESLGLWSNWMRVLRFSLKELFEVYGLPGAGFYCDAQMRTE
jgi:hypothetical protein